MKAKSLIALAFVAGSALALPAQAAERELSEQIFAVMADTIAAQGNQALREIRDDVRRNLVSALKPLLPEPDHAQEQPAQDGDRRNVQ